MATDDPFLLFHLAELDFAVTASTLSSLSAYQLPLAQYSTDYSEALEKPLKKAWRQRRERARARMGQPIGMHASEADKQADPVFTRFECIGLDFALTSLQDLTSAQLACVAFHPDANADLVETAEEIFFARRERDFSAGLSLPPLPAPVAAPAPAPAPIPAAVLPPRPETALPAFAAATPATPLNSIAASTTVPPLPTPVSVPAKRGASAWLDDDEMDESAAVEPAPKKISLDEWRLQQREKEGGACSVHEDARSSSSRTGRRSKRGEKRERETSPRGSESSAGRRKTEGAQNWLDDLPKGSRNGFARESRREERDGRRDTRDLRKDERDGRRDIRDEGYGSRERRPSGSGYGHRDDERRGCEDGGRRVEDRRDDLSGARREGWSRLPQEDRLATGLSLYTTRAAPPTGPSNPRAHLSLPPPAPPREQDVPAEIVQTLKIVFIRQIPENNNVGDVLRLLQSFHRVAPVGVKIVRNGVAPSIRTGARVVNAYAAYEYAEDAQTVKCCLDGFVLGGENLQAVDGFPPLSLDGTPKLTVWKWTLITPNFRQAFHHRQLDQYYSQQQQPPTSTEPRISVAQQLSRPPLDPPYNDSIVGKDNLPRGISDSLYQLYASGFPLDVKIEELRDFVDYLDGLVGIGLSSEKSISKHQRCAAWFAFTKSADCEAACSALQNKYFDMRASKPLVVEVAKDKQRRNYWFWSDMSKSFRNEHKGRNTQLTPQAPPQPDFQTQPFAPNPSYAASLGLAPSPYAQAQPPYNGGFMQAPPPLLKPKEEPAPTRGFVHPSRLALMDAKPTLPPIETHPADANDDDDDEMIIVEASSSTSRRPPPPTLTDANAAASSAAVKNVEDVWASKRRATLAQRIETGTSSSASRQASVTSAASSSSPRKSSLPVSNAAVSAFIQQAVAEGEVSMARKAAVSSAPPSGALFTRLDPLPHTIRQNGTQRSPLLPLQPSLPQSPPPTGPAAYTGRLPPPTGPRSLAIPNGGMIISAVPLVEDTGTINAERDEGKGSSEVKPAEVVEVEESRKTAVEVNGGNLKDGEHEKKDAVVENGVSAGDAKEEKSTDSEQGLYGQA